MVKNKIAIIEDDVVIAAMYEYKLIAEGFDVKRAENGVAGLKLSKEWKPDLLLLDIKMPEMCGDEMLEKLRATEWGSNVRVIIMTNISRDEAPSVLRFLSVDRYLVKAHYTPAQVVTVVHEILHGRKRRITSA